MRSWPKAAAALVVSVATFVGSGNSPFYVEKGLGVSLEYIAQKHALILRRDGSDLKCWIRVRATATSPVHARFTNGRRADVRPELSDPSVLAISEPLKKGEQWPQELEWTSGLALVVGPLAQEPTGWEVQPASGDPDSDWRVARRLFLVVVSVIALAFSGFLTVAAIRAEKTAPARATALAIFDSLTDELEGADEEETKTIRRFIREATTIGFEAAKTKLPPGKPRRLALDAHRLFVARVDAMMKDLGALRDKL